MYIEKRIICSKTSGKTPSHDPLKWGAREAELSKEQTGENELFLFIFE
jgi:hypothetical protein